jgi:S-DNA-T family DNA segregation ATPase FtsK/SpoIIIE
MATAAARPKKRDLGPDWRDALRESFGRLAMRSWGALLLGLSVAVAVALASHSGTDPSFTTAAAGPPANWLGSFGAYASDALLLLFGLGTILLLPVIGVAGLRMMRLTPSGRIGRSLLIAALGAILLGVAVSLSSASAVSGMPSGWGGALGMAGAHGLNGAIGLIGNASVEGPLRLTLLLLFAAAGLTVAYLALGLTAEEKHALANIFRRDPAARARAPEPRRTAEPREDKSVAAAPPKSRPAVAVTEPAKPIASRGGASRKPATQQSLALGDNYALPSVELLAQPPAQGRQQIDRAGLERNARLLESVLEDFHVRGDIVEVRPGPVVTMYELEPASGIKASRVIQLADDIARNMSALSARVATIPGRSVIGIELPNPKRESVALAELIGSQAYEDQNMSLPLVLGKNIAGDPVIADLAPMPHLLVAGTTGSGKSVGLNCMILSLLYRMTPDECRLIMIDPKMLELSMYEDIPHLLAPVVTEPGKAIRALKWTVEQMEERYRMMASLACARCRASTPRSAMPRPRGPSSGGGYRPATMRRRASPSTRPKSWNMRSSRRSWLVVDELADLMMTAGKEVEFLIQRLAQKARAAGIT